MKPLTGRRFHSLISKALSAALLLTGSVIVQAQPRLYSWGYNGYSQLGDGTATTRKVPISVKAPLGSSVLGNVRSVSVGDRFVVAARTDGSAYAWGYNGSGQLGNNTTTNSHKPSQILGPNGVGVLDQVTAVAAGDSWAMALKSDGTVWSWGGNSFGQLGDNTSTTRRTPVQMHGPNNVGFMTHVIGIAGGAAHSVLLRNDGTVYALGYNGYGQIGDGTNTSRKTPTQVKGPGGEGFLTGVSAVAVGGSATFALKTDGTVWGFGHNAYGQLGDGTKVNRQTPVQVVGPGGEGFLTNVVALEAGTYHGMALKSDGTVWMWGLNGFGNLGDGTQTQRLTPVQVKGPGGEGFLTGISAIAAGPSHAVARRQDGAVFAWGGNSFGILGDNTATARFTPIQVHGPNNQGFLDEVANVAANEYNTFYVRTDGTLWGVGYNTNGQLGNDTTTNSWTPVRTVGPEGLDVFPDAKTIAARGYHTVVLKNDGTVFAFGANSSGQLGDGTTTNRSVAVQVVGPGGEGFLTDVVAIATGAYHTLALKADGTVWAWGTNGNGALGDGTTTARHTPVQVKGPGGVGVLTDIIAISAGEYHSLALREDGSVFGWGSNANGQLGDGTYQARLTPVPMLGTQGTDPLRNIVALSAGDSFTLVLSAAGSVYATGMNTQGQLGDGTTTTRSRPARVVGEGNNGLLNSVVAIGAGQNYGAALYFDGRVYTWGNNDYGQLGDNTDIARTTPALVLGPEGNGFLTDVATIAVGRSHTLALKFDGTVWAWGSNGWGQLGDDTNTNRRVPVPVLGPNGEGVLSSIITVAAGETHSVVISGQGALQGSVILQNSACSNCPITFQFRPVDGTPFTRIINAGPMGLFSFTNIPPGEYDIAVKGNKWLQRTIHVNTTNNNVLNLRIFLLGGDANDDNSIDVLDLDALIQAFDTVPEFSNWNPSADFNCDDSVDVLDLDLLLQNFDLLGDA